MTAEEGRQLLVFVRQAAEALLAGRPTPPEPPEFVAHIPHSGVFITFHRGAQLRGCMGRLRAADSLQASLLDVVESSLHDPRFTHDPITPRELAALTIEVSVLGPLRVVKDAREIVPGQSGIVVTRGGCSGCFLPQVARERGWSAEELLTECCRLKAGLPPDAWRSPGTRIEVFEAEIIAEQAGARRSV
jgi:AmmeMemoRadiSam system protein A